VKKGDYMNKDCKKFQPDIADYAAGRYEYIKDYDGFFEHLRQCQECRDKLFGMEDMLYEFQSADGLSPEFVRKMEEIKAMARKEPPPPAQITEMKAQMKEGIRLYKDKKLFEAISQFSDIIRKTEDRELKADAYYHLGLTYVRMNNADSALRNFSKAIEYDPDDADAYYHRAYLYEFLLRNDAAAVKDYSSAIRLNPDYTEALYNRGVIYYLNGMYRQTIDDCEQALAGAVDKSQLYLLRAGAYEALGNYQQAIADCNETFKTLPEEQTAYLIRGRSYGILGEWKPALADFNELIRLAPDNSNGYYYRGVIYAWMGELKNAIADFRKSLALKPGDVNSIESLLKAERQLLAQEMEQKVKKVQEQIVQRYKKDKSKLKDKYENEIAQLKSEIEMLKENQKMLLEIARQKPEYHYHIQTQEMKPSRQAGLGLGYFPNLPDRQAGMGQGIIMPAPSHITEKPTKQDGNKK
jgi:tetratricopeptide (TPR) repeat protein